MVLERNTQKAEVMKLDELVVKVNQNIGEISANFAEIETQLKVKLAGYKGVVVTEESLADSKKDLAEIRKISKAINDEKIRVKKIWEKPYKDFETKCKNLMAIVGESETEISSQISEIEKKLELQKKDHLLELYKANIDEFGEYLPFENTLGEKWANKSYDDKTYLYDLSEKKISIRTNIEAIKALNSEIEEELLTVYKRSGNDLSKAITRHTQYLADKERVKAQAEAEAKKNLAEAVSEALETTKAKNEPTPLLDIDNAPEVVMTKTVKIVISESDWEQVKAFLDFSQVSYQVEGE